MSTCLTCDGSGIIITCCDDLCANSDHCIHGDGEEICPDCEGDGEIIDDDDYDEGFYFDDPDIYPDGPTLFDASIGEEALIDDDNDGTCESCGGEYGDGWSTCTCEDFQRKNAA